MEKFSQDIVGKLKQRIRDNTDSVEVSKKATQGQNDFDKDIINQIVHLEHTSNQLRAQLKLLRSQQGKNNYLSTTNFFNPSLAKDVYNMNGNSLQTNSFLAVRQMLGIVNNNTPNVKQTIEGVDVNSGNGSISSTNGTAVGLTQDKQIRGWWLWIFILNRIDYFKSLVRWETDDLKLKRALEQYMFDAVLSGYAVIVKKDDKYYSYAVTDVELDEDGEVKTFKYYNSSFVINTQKKDDAEKSLRNSSTLPTDSFVVGKWKGNGYNIWFYVMSYLMNAVDLLGIYWNRARLAKPLVLQLKGNDSTSSYEAQQIMDPNQIIVEVASTGTLMEDEEQTGESDNVSNQFENRYDVKTLLTGEETQFTFANFANWIAYWDNEIGIRSAPTSANTANIRKVSDEVQPLTLKESKLQYDMVLQLDYLKQEIKDKFGVEVDYIWEDDSLLKETVDENPSYKAEEGNQKENEHNNGEQ